MQPWMRVPWISQILLLEARRHEKDFLARRDDKYLARMDETIAGLKKDAAHLASLAKS